MNTEIENIEWNDRKNVYDGNKVIIETDNAEKIKTDFLGKKVKRNKNSNSEKSNKNLNFKPIPPRHDLKRCNVCLEFEKYSDSKLRQCKKCLVWCHLKCLGGDTFTKVGFIKGDTSQINENDKFFTCEKCREIENLNEKLNYQR